jgi:hypothetical protein
MTVAPVSPPLSGDAEASKPGNSDLLRRPPSPRSPLPESRVVRGSRFWALAGDNSDEEDEAGDLASRPGVAVSPRSGPSAVTLGDFFEPVWQKVTGAAASVVGRCRQRFAPGGRGSWSLRPSAPSPARPCAVPPLPGGDLLPELFPPWPSRADPVVGDVPKCSAGNSVQVELAATPAVAPRGAAEVASSMVPPGGPTSAPVGGPRSVNCVLGQTDGQSLDPDKSGPTVP